MRKPEPVDPEVKTGIPWVFRVLFFMFLAFSVTITLLPLVLLVGYPVLLIIALFSPLRWFLIDGRGLLSRRLAELVCYWAICFGLVVMAHGLMIVMDSSLKGAPPTPEEKRLGLMIAFTGAAISSLAAVGAYGFQPWSCPGGKRGVPELDDLPAGPGD
jgi:hypothetical protein